MIKLNSCLNQKLKKKTLGVKNQRAMQLLQWCWKSYQKNLDKQINRSSVIRLWLFITLEKRWEGMLNPPPSRCSDVYVPYTRLSVPLSHLHCERTVSIYERTQRANAESERWPIPEQNMNAVIVNVSEWMQTLNWAQSQVQSELWTHIEWKMRDLFWLFRKFSPSCILTIIHGKTFGFVFLHFSKSMGFRFNQSHK